MFINFERGHNSLASLFIVNHGNLPRKFSEKMVNALRENNLVCSPSTKPSLMFQSSFKTIVISSCLSSLITIIFVTFLLRNTAFVNVYFQPSSARLKLEKPDETINRNIVTRSTSNFTNAVHLIYLPHVVELGAVCLDGSPPAYYFREGHGEGYSKWIIHFFGGAWCFDEESCLQRSKTVLGSSKDFPTHPPKLQGILSGNSKMNPDFYNWNLVLLCYCDGASFTGFRREPINVDGQLIYIRGKKILQVIVDQLLLGQLKRAERVLLSGTSAGGLAAMLNADYIRRRIPSTADVRVFADSGYFIDVAAINGHDIINAHFRKMVEVHDSINHLDRDCVSSLKPAIRWKCIFPQHAFKYIQTPVFVLQSAYDPWQLIHIRGINCQTPEYADSYKMRRNRIVRPRMQRSSADNGMASGAEHAPDHSIWRYKHIHGIYCKPPECTRAEMSGVLQYRNVSLFALRPVLTSKNGGLILTSCLEHSQSLYDDTWNDVYVNGFSLSQAVGNWAFGRTSQNHYVDCDYPCNPSCANVW